MTLDRKDAEGERPPTGEERHEARRKQEAAEREWRPEHARWADEAVSERADVLFGAIFEKAAIGIALVDLKGRIAKANPALQTMLAADDLVGKAFTDISHPEDAALDQRLFEQLLAREHDHYTFEKRYRRSDGGTLWGRLTASLIADADGLPQFVIGVVEDVSERVRAEEASRQRDRAIRDAYADVIAAVTGGHLVLLDDEEIKTALGEPLGIRHVIASPQDVSRARRALRDELTEVARESSCVDALLVAASEAITNALKHAGRGTLQSRRKDHALQVVVVDEGAGIRFADLPRLTLVPGSSTTESLGMGFTVMLASCDKVAVRTGDSGTEVLLECGNAGR